MKTVAAARKKMKNQTLPSSVLDYYSETDELGGNEALLSHRVPDIEEDGWRWKALDVLYGSK